MYLTSYDVWDYEFLIHYNILIDGWDFCTQDDIGDYDEVEWF